MSLIHEVVVTTVSADGKVHIAPMGPHADDAGHVLLKPFKPSTTLSNVLATGCAVINMTTDVRVFAGCVTGRRDWPVVPADRVRGARLQGTLAHRELELVAHVDDDTRPVLTMRVVHTATHAPFPGFVRAQAAVVEGAVLVSRLGMLTDDKVDAEMAYLQIAMDKTAGAHEREAWGWLQDAVRRHRAAR